MLKDKIRKEILERRKRLSREEVERKSGIIHEKLLNSGEYKKAKRIVCYISMERSNEVETKTLVERFLKDGKLVFVPYVENEKVDIAQISGMDDLEKGAFGILEPKKELRTQLDKSQIDLIIVPGLAFDKLGNRIGYGYGYYDEFLACTNCIKIGFAFSSDIIDIVPRDVWDVRVDKVITDSE